MWQRLIQARGDEFQFVSVAMEVQGAEAARPWAKATLDTFPTLVDAENQLGDAFGFKAIPNGIFVGADGRIDGVEAGGFEIRRDETRQLVERWLTADDLTIPAREDEHEWSGEALRLFRAAGAAVRLGDRDQAIELLRRAFPLEPDNYIIRKQLWALEHPERFYAGDVDYAWQRDQLAQGR